MSYDEQGIDRHVGIDKCVKDVVTTHLEKLDRRALRQRVIKEVGILMDDQFMAVCLRDLFRKEADALTMAVTEGLERPEGLLKSDD